MKKFLLLFLLLFSLPLLYSGYSTKSVDVTVTMDEDGNGKVVEIIKFNVDSDESQATYISGLSTNDLAFWSTTTQLSDMRVHLNSNVVNIQNFRIVPDILKNCNQATNVCLGEIELNYDISPYYDLQTNEVIEGTGLFTEDAYKPRTTKYSINEEALFFETTEVEYITRLNRFTRFTIVIPEQSNVLESNPDPSDMDESIQSYTWRNTLLVKFAFIYEIEKGLDEEILDFFSDLYGNVGLVLFGSQGPALLIILLILIVFYVALISVKRRKKK